MKPQHFLCLLLVVAFNCLLVSSQGTAYCTYHNYYATEPLTDVACSDGANGIMTRFGYSNINPMFPYVTAFSGAGWNSPKCGECIKLTDNASGRTIYVTVIDQCGGPPGGYNAHFDIAPPAFNSLFGGAGQNAGHGSASWSVVASSNCHGNKGNSGGGGGNPPPPPPPPSGGGKNYKIRCGSSWTDANGKCGALCSSDAQCGGAHCFADLATGPCGKAVGDEFDTFGDAAVEDAAVEDAAFEDAVVEDAAFEDAVVEDAAVEDAAVEDAVVEDAVVEDAVVEDAAVEDAVVEDAAFEDAAVEDTAVDYSVDAANVDYAVDYAVTDSSSTGSSSTDMSGWMIALLVLGAIVIVLLVVVVIQLALISKRHT